MVAIEVARIAFSEDGCCSYNEDAYRALAVALVYHAVLEMRDTGGCRAERRLGATVWLASKAALCWFDRIGIGQRYGLWKMGWQVHAEELLADEGVELSSAEHLVLEFGINALAVKG